MQKKIIFFLNNEIISNLFIAAIFISILYFGINYSIYNHDFHHWGYILSNYFDYNYGLLPFSEIYLQYGVGQIIFFKLCSLVVDINIFSIGAITSLVYAVNIVFFLRF